MLQRLWVNECSKLLVCVDTYDDHVMKGRFYRSGQEGARFESLSEFLVQAEQFLEDAGIPQSYTAARQFSELLPEERTAAPRILTRGQKATFELQVLFRQNASWQGVICWKDNSREEHFRSVLELVLLMNSALRSAG